MDFELVQSARLIGFNPADGWPQTFQPSEVAKLQGKDDSDSLDILQLLQSDIENGNVAYTTTEVDEFPPTLTDKTVDVSLPNEWKWDMPKPRRRLMMVYVTRFFHITATAVSEWFQGHRIEPSRYIAAWFKHFNVCVAPKQALQDWSLTKPDRFQGYGMALYDFLHEAHRLGKPKPTAYDVLKEFAKNTPQDIFRVEPGDFLVYMTTSGSKKKADIRAIAASIERMTVKKSRLSHD